MAKIFGPQIKKLQKALNDKFDQKILINKTQFYSESAKRPVEILVIKQAVYDESRDKYKNIELFSSASDVQIVLWLRDLWYELNNWEVPTDNKDWLKAKEAYNLKHQPIEVS